MADRNSTREANRSGRELDRRSVLRGIGTTAAAGAGLTAVSGSASAQVGVEIDEVVDVSSWFGFGNDLPVVDELFVFVHGWFGDTTVESQAEDVATSLAGGGYFADANVAIEWDATNFIYTDAESDTEDVGADVADLIADFYDAGGGNVRLVGHSLGGRVVCWTANKIDDGYDIETIAPLGAAADGSQVCPGGEWYDGLVDNAEEVRNYYSQNDSTVGGAYGGFGDTALGTEGANCPGASNYTDVDVTASVGGHLEYLGDAAVGEDLADAIL
ncbi:alpha/beta hydrolase [Halorientalis pallida]|uniref:alpha/beta hydrolase n=1 Tax=Halorientalis pallida TaxID=2479928 RepID=UPI003C6FCDF8